MKGFDALGRVAEYTSSTALFKAVQSTSLSADTRNGIKTENQFQQ